MSVASNLNKIVYSGNGVTTNWSFTFPIILSTDIEVILTDTNNVDGAPLGSNFTIDTVNSLIVYPSVASGLPPLPSGWKITLLRVEPITQLITLASQGPFTASSIESALDKLTMIAQQHDEALSRTVQYPISQTPTTTDSTTAINTIVAAEVSAAASAAAAAASAASPTVYWGGTSGGSANAQTLTPSPVLGAYATGLRFMFKAGFSNSGAATINISALGTKSLVTQAGSALVSGQIVSGNIYTIVYDGTNFYVLEILSANQLVSLAGILSTAGVIPIANIPSIPNSSLTAGVGTGNNNIVALNGSGQLPAVDGSLVTNATKLKIGSITRDVTAATGSVAYTGIGFRPKVVIFLSVLSPTFSLGWDDGTTPLNMYYSSSADVAGTISIRIGDASFSNYQSATISAFGADGFTLAWVKTGTPTGTATINYLAIA